jgi:hypothetical protein
MSPIPAGSTRPPASRPRRAVVLLPVVSADGTGPVGSRRVVRAGARGRRWRAASASGAVLLAGLPGRGRRRPGRGRAGCSSTARSARRNGAGPGAAGRDRGDTPAPGATIRAAGDELGVPTSTLRHWLREAGVRVGADGTLTGSASPAPSPAGTDKPPGMDEEEHGSGGRGTGEEPAAPASGDLPPAPAAVSGAPVQTLNELAQAGYVTRRSCRRARAHGHPALADGGMPRGTRQRLPWQHAASSSAPPARLVR